MFLLSLGLMWFVFCSFVTSAVCFVVSVFDRVVAAAVVRCVFAVCVVWCFLPFLWCLDASVVADCRWWVYGFAHRLCAVGCC